MRKRRMPPPTFVLQRLRGASLASLARKYGVSPKVAYKWQRDALDSGFKYVRPLGLCRALARRITDKHFWSSRSLPRFAHGVRHYLDRVDDVDTTQRDHAYAMLKGGHISMTSPPSTS